MKLFHCTTPKKVSRYQASGNKILAPVRGFSNRDSADWWAARTGRTIVLEIDVPDQFTHPLPDHRTPYGRAYWCERDIPITGKKYKNMSKSDDKLKIRLWLSIGIANANQDETFTSDDYTKSEWDALTAEERSDYLDMLAKDHMSNYLDCGAAVVEDE